MIEERDSVEAVVNAQWTAVLGRSPDRFDLGFFSAGGSSFQGALLLSKLANCFGLAPTFQTLLDFPTVESLSAWIRDQPRARTSRAFPLNAGDGSSRPPLLFIPGANGDLILLNRLAGKVVTRPVWGLETRGLVEGDGGPLRSATAIARDIAEQVETVLPRRPLHVGGFSAGANFSIELGRELQSRGWEVLSVALIGPSAPASRTKPAAGYDEQVSARLQKLYGKHRPASSPAVTTQAGPGPGGVELSSSAAAELVRRAHVWASNMVAVDEHFPDELRQVRAVVAVEEGGPDTFAYWRSRFPDDVIEIKAFPGDHFSLIAGDAAVPFVSNRLEEFDKAA